MGNCPENPQADRTEQERCPLKILVNALLVSPQPSGLGRYILQLLEAMGPHLLESESLPVVAPQGEGHRVSAAAGPAAEVIETSFTWDNRAARILYEQTQLPRLARSLGAGCLFGPAYAVPVSCPVPCVVTVHDLAFIRYPETQKLLNRLYLRTITKLSVMRSARVIAVSQNTQREIEAHFGVDPGKIRLVYNGISPRFAPAPPAAVTAVRERYALPERFALYVGNLEPRKNLTRLVHAFRMAKRRAGFPHALVLAGQKAWLYGEIEKAIEEAREDVEIVTAGYIPAEELPALYSAADLFLYPSLYEGFGLPVLEAMACGAPVITSNTSSLPEVAGDAGRLVDPFSVEAMAAAIAEVLTDDALRREMAEKGKEQAKRFSWDRAARETLQVLREAAQASS